MNVENVIVLTLVILSLIIISMFSIELFVPLNQKYEMNALLRPYVFLLETQGSLTADEESQLRESLTSLGLSSVVIHIEDDGRFFGSTVYFRVTAVSHRNQIINLYQRSNESIPLTYERKIIVKKIIN